MSTTNSSNSSVTNDNSIVVKSHHDTSISFKKCSFSWTIDNYSIHDARKETVKSSLFSAVDDDFVWYLKFSTSLESTTGSVGNDLNPTVMYLANRSPGNLSLCTTAPLAAVRTNSSSKLGRSTSSNLVMNTSQHRKRHAIFLYPNSYQDLKKYTAISGEAQFSVVVYENNDKVGIGTKKTTFKIQSQSDDKTQASAAVGFFDIIDTSMGNFFKIHRHLTISCDISYVKIKNINLCERSDSNLRIDFERLLADKHFSDVIVSVKGKNYPVYKGILAARCPVFNTMFRSDMLESTTNHVDIPDINQDVFEEMLFYIYTGKIKNCHSAFELLSVADKYDLKGLKAICEEELSKQLSKDNAIKTLILADTHKADGLKTQALQFIKSNAHYTNIKNTEIWNVLTTFHPNLMKDMLAFLLEK